MRSIMSLLEGELAGRNCLGGRCDGACVAVGRSIVRPAACLIADDDAPSRILARQALDGRGFLVVGEVGDATAAVAAARRERPDICLVDVRMPGGGIRATAEIVDAVPDTTVVMFTGSQSDTDLFDALRAGASGYLFKNTDPARLPLALHGVFRGEAALPRTLAAPADRGVPAAGAAQAAAAAQRTGRRPDTEGSARRSRPTRAPSRARSWTRPRSRRWPRRPVAPTISLPSARACSPGRPSPRNRSSRSCPTTRDKVRADRRPAPAGAPRGRTARPAPSAQPLTA
jgi:DNA-binding NarL/FixJ family response regulator